MYIDSSKNWRNAFKAFVTFMDFSALVDCVIYLRALKPYFMLSTGWFSLSRLIFHLDKWEIFRYWIGEKYVAPIYLQKQIFFFSSIKLCHTLLFNFSNYFYANDIFLLLIIIFSLFLFYHEIILAVDKINSMKQINYPKKIILASKKNIIA